MTDGSPGHADTPRLLVLSGPSGVGKSTVVRELRAHHPEVCLSVSVTTRFPRPGEIDGVHYHFVSDAAFDALIAEDGLLEWATFAGHRYGTPRAPVERCLAALHERELQEQSREIDEKIKYANDAEKTELTREKTRLHNARVESSKRRRGAP